MQNTVRIYIYKITFLFLVRIDFVNTALGPSGFNISSGTVFKKSQSKPQAVEKMVQTLPISNA